MVICPKCNIGTLKEENFSLTREPNWIITCDVCDYTEDEFGRIL